ncbi:MAG: hypothetical protein IIB00_11215 [candidate division Zixibacteria bacterium]|nr:hypothetical protein [candidate division Zixibacteria bacterium]
MNNFSFKIDNSRNRRAVSLWTPVLAICALIFSLLGTNAESVPRFSAEQGLECGECHFSPGGGAMRNEYGHFTMSVNELTLQSTKKKLLPSYRGPRLSEAITIGSDMRMRLTESGSYERFQADIYVSIEPFDRVYFNTTISGGAIDENYMLVTNLNRDYYVQMGRFYPQFGMKVEDFSSFVRQKSGFFHRLALNGITLGTKVLKRQVSISYFSQGDQGIFVGNVSRVGWFGSVGYLVGFSARFSEELDNNTHGAFPAAKSLYGGFSWKGHSLMLEANLIGESNDSLALYAGGTIKFIPGLYGRVDYNYFDPDRHLQTGYVSFTRVSIEFWPIPFMEINPGVSFYTAGPQDGQGEFELRTHFAY